MHHVDFRAMGSMCRIVADGCAAASLDAATQIVTRLERTWTRFSETSEVSAVNNNAGNIQLVSSDTYTLFDHAVAAQRATGGRFNALMLRQLLAHGYTQTWDSGVSAPTSFGPRPATIEEIGLLPEVQGVRIPSGTSFDPGGIGKGLGVDIVTEFLISEGASTISVELGGDLRVHGVPWYGPEWRIAVAHPFQAHDEIGAFTPAGGAVATSSRLRKRWTFGDRRYHHLLDPRTGEPAVTDLVAVSCCAAKAWWAEVAAKAVLISGSTEAIGLFDEFGVHGIAVCENGAVVRSAEHQEVLDARELEGAVV